jgi:hypothetical protein
VGFSSNPRHDRIHLRRLRSPGCDRPARTTRRSATPRCCTRSLSLVVHDKDVRASIEEQSRDVLPPPRGREDYGTLAVIVTARRDDVDGRTPYPRVEMTLDIICIPSITPCAIPTFRRGRVSGRGGPRV